MFPLDRTPAEGYTLDNYIGQFATILSVNKTRGSMGRILPIFVFGCGLRPFFIVEILIACVYAVLTYAQNLLLPGSATWAIQFRAAEAMCVLALFSPAAIPGLTLGCLLFNLSQSYVLPLDFIVGSAASFLSCAGMYLLRKITLKGYPLPALLLPGICNGLLVGWELQLYTGGGFWLHCFYVFIGETAVLLTLGTALHYAIKNRRLEALLK